MSDIIKAISDVAKDADPATKFFAVGSAALLGLALIAKGLNVK
ncbi:hypothetical protein [Castellaniella caeni]|nr:hypothetical protein [Castellaniella caeni]